MSTFTLDLTPEVEPARELTPLVAELKQVRDAKKALETREAEIKAEIGELDPDSYVAGDYILEVTRPSRFDAKFALANLSDEELAQVTVPVVDSDRAKRKLSGDRYAEACQKPGSLVLRIKEVEV